MVAKDRPQLGCSKGAIGLGVKVGVHNPKALYHYVRSGLCRSVQGQVYDLAIAIGWDTWALSSYWDAIKTNTAFKDYVEAKIGDVNYGQVVIPELLYVLVRKLCPAIVVETGVAAGVSSAYILQALEDNEHGKLYSIDCPNHGAIEGKPIPKGMEVGFAVPRYLKHRWKLQIGKSKDLLPSLMRKLGGIGIFLHDSEHSFDNMTFEYELAWENLVVGGLLVSHDINENRAFREFAQIVKRKGREIFFTGMGVIRK